MKLSLASGNVYIRETLYQNKKKQVESMQKGKKKYIKYEKETRNPGKFYQWEAEQQPQSTMRWGMYTSRDRRHLR